MITTVRKMMSIMTKSKVITWFDRASPTALSTSLHPCFWNLQMWWRCQFILCTGRRDSTRACTVFSFFLHWPTRLRCCTHYPCLLVYTGRRDDVFNLRWRRHFHRSFFLRLSHQIKSSFHSIHIHEVKPSFLLETCPWDETVNFLHALTLPCFRIQPWLYW